MAHTPGPWRIDMGCICSTRQNALATTSVIAKVHTTAKTPEEIEGNARLIAAAPAMYEALAKAVKMIALNPDLDYPADLDTYSQMIEALRLAESPDA